jgi:hypothetical protein
MKTKTIKGGLIAAFLLMLTLKPFKVNSQTVSDEVNSIHGNFQIDAQYYQPDSLIGAPKVPEKMLSNAWGAINYQKGKFSAGIRYEAYNGVMQGFDPRYKGQGITNRYARYRDNLLDITVGNIYEQFGSGMLLRTYFEPGLLYDNSLDGVRVISNPYKGITLKGLVGKQRSFFTVGQGIVRGVDGEININEMLDSAIGNIKTKFIIGGSFVSKFQADQDPDYVLPENVGSYGGRINIIHEGFNFFGEYVIKENDPSLANTTYMNGKKYLNYKQGEGGFLSTSYSTKGFSILFQAKRIDNMSYRSERDASLQQLMINYLPATTRQHTYLMPAYAPYATQPLGEVSGMLEVTYKIPKGTLLGGKYGTEVTLNGSVANGLKQYNVNDSTTELTLYKTEYSDFGGSAPKASLFGWESKLFEREYYHDFFIEINKKINKKVKINIMLANQFNNINVVQHQTPKGPYKNAVSNIAVVDVTYKYKLGSTIRCELQTSQKNNKDTLNYGSWVVGVVEWNINTNFFVAAIDQYNYGNPVESLQIHYPYLSTGYTTGPYRIAVQYGKQRAGIFCVGGVCRFVPASNGFAISITASF